MEHSKAIVRQDLNSLAIELYWWHSVFNIAFFRGNPLPVPMLTFDKSRVDNLGSYNSESSGWADRNQINLNRIYLCRPLFEILVTLIHEMTHSWEHSYVPDDKRTKNWYHTIAFREKMEEIGIITDSKGIEREVRDPFRSLLEHHGVSFNGRKDNGRLLIAPPKKPKGKSKLKKWTCGCQIVRVGKREFKARCLICNNEFHLDE